MTGTEPGVAGTAALRGAATLPGVGLGLCRIDPPDMTAVITRIAAEQQRIPGQVVLPWHLQRGVTVVPKMTARQRMRNSRDLFSFCRSEKQMSEITRRKHPGPHRPASAGVHRGWTATSLMNEGRWPSSTTPTGRVSPQ